MFSRLSKQGSYKALPTLSQAKEGQEVDLAPIKQASKQMIERMIQKEKSLIEE